MNKEKIKELFSINYIRLLAEYFGYYLVNLNIFPKLFNLLWAKNNDL